MASVPCARAAYCLGVEMARLSSSSVGEFRGSRVSLNDGVGAVCMWGVLPVHRDDKLRRRRAGQRLRVLRPTCGPQQWCRCQRACGVRLARRDDKAVRFEQGWEHRDLCGQVIIATRGLRLSLRGALVLVATVATAMMVMMAMATAMAMRCDGGV